jgi:hypothetical protein
MLALKLSRLVAPAVSCSPLEVDGLIPIGRRAVERDERRPLVVTVEDAVYECHDDLSMSIPRISARNGLGGFLWPRRGISKLLDALPVVTVIPKQLVAVLTERDGLGLDIGAGVRVLDGDDGGGLRGDIDGQNQVAV